jgi:ubiquitin-protein ligase
MEEIVSKRRISRDLKALTKKRFVLPTANYIQFPTEDQIVFVNKRFIWNVFIIGPESTPYEGYKWTVQTEFPDNFPFSPPIIRFIDKIFHPNISFDTGTTYLFEQWACTSIDVLFEKLNKILITPILDQPLNSVALTLFIKQNGYPEKVISYIEDNNISNI